MHIKNFDPYDFSKKEIEGVPVYYKNLPWAPCIHIRFVFSVGAFNDPNDKEGLAHFLEHMIGNGSPLLPDKKAVKNFSKTYMLNSRNAFTSHIWTAYVGKCLPENFKKVFQTMQDYVFNPFLRKEDVEHERKVITQEAWGRYKNDKFLKYVKEVSSNIYHGHERARISSPLGWPDTVAKISQEDVSDFHKTNYVKENLSIFLVGAVDEKDLDSIAEFLKNIPNGKKAEKSTGKISKPLNPRFEKTGDEIGDPKEQLEFSIYRSMDDITEEEWGIANQGRMLLYDILFERLRIEHSLCYGVSINWTRYKDYMEAVVSVETSLDKLDLVEKEIRNVIQEIIEGKWKDRFSVIHKMSLDQIRSSERSSDFIIQTSSSDLLATNQIRTLEEILRNEEMVTYEDVAKLTKRVFDPEYIFTEVILPSKK